MLLEDWCLSKEQNPYIAPELQVTYLHGNVYGHPRFRDGHPVRTSAIKGLKDGFIETISGSLYELGKVREDYEEKYPNAKERLMNALAGIKGVQPVSEAV